MDFETRKEEPAAGSPRWMTTFADLMSLLLVFFVLLLSFSVLDNQKFKEVAGSMKDAFGVQKSRMDLDTIKGVEMISQEFQTVPLGIQVEIMEVIEDEVNAGMIEVEYNSKGLTLRVNAAVAFDSGRANIHQRFKAILDKLGKRLADLEVNIMVHGHTDNTPLKSGGPFKSNWSLSAARATSVVEYWLEAGQIDPDRLSVMGYADRRPIATNDTAVGRSKNRRVEFVITPINRLEF